jgi:hypothetical protein
VQVCRCARAPKSIDNMLRADLPACNGHICVNAEELRAAENELIDLLITKLPQNVLSICLHVQLPQNALVFVSV